MVWRGTEMSDKWYANYDKVIYLGNFLCYDLGLRAEELQYYYDKPWKYPGEWEQIEGEYNE